MRITFQPTEATEIGNQNNVRQNEVRKVEQNRSFGVLYGQSADGNWIAGSKTIRDKGKTMAELQQEAESMDAAVQQDYRIVLSNTMSAEDYAQMEEEGFDFSAMDPETAVTIVDKIKAELVRSGKHIAGYTDDLDRDTLSAALGSDALASAVTESFQEADIPLTEENINAVKQAWDMTRQLNVPSEGAYRYMVDNGMEPEIWNFYLSQSSGASGVSGTNGAKPLGTPRFYAEDIQGYYAESAPKELLNDFSVEVDKILQREEIEVSEENRKTAQTLLEDNLPITKENIELRQSLESVAFPVEESTFARAAATAVAEGRAPIYANLAKTDNIYEKAVEWLEYYQGDVEQFLDVEDISSRRLLEEIRLRMSAEVNVKLIRSGFAIDTEPMEQLVEALRKAETEVAEKYFPREETAVEKYELYRSTNEIVKEMPGLPAQILGPWSAEERIGTLAEFHAEGKSLQESYAKARTEYEALMTVPRKDLGDSIRKAFANVDDILQDLGLDTVEMNRRAVRILGYNRMSIDAANIERVQVADEQVRAIVEKMTPASVLKMIRDDKNPLAMNFDELEQYFESLPESYEESAESYSRFLYGLEQNKQITEQEREAYIGIYRMLHQIEKTDGAAIGALVNVGAELQFSTLLSAVRSGKFKSINVSVAEDFGTVVDVIRNGKSISDQIAKGFVKDAEVIMTQMSHGEEQKASYRQMQIEQLRQAADVSAESVEALIRGKLPLSAENLLAAQALEDRSYNPFKEWKLKKEQLQKDKQVAGELQESALKELVGALEDKEEFQIQYQELVEAMEQEVQELSLQQADSSMDVRSLQLLHKQLSVAGAMAREEEYTFPMYIGDELAKVHLVLDRKGEEKGTVRVAVNWSGEESLEAHFQVKDHKISGFLVENAKGSVTKAERIADIFTDSIQNSMGSDWEVETLPIVNRQAEPLPHRKHASVNREVPGGEETYMEVDNTELYRIAKVFLEAVQK